MNATEKRTGFAVLATIVLLEIVHGIEEIALLPHYFVDSLGLGASAVGWVISSYLIADLLTRAPAGWLTDRFGRRNVLLAGMILTCAVIPPMALVTDATSLFVLNALNGVGAGTMWPAVYALVADTFEAKRRGAAMSAVNMFMLAGLASGPIIGNVVVGLMSFGPAFALCFAIAAASLVIALVYLKEPDRRTALSASGPAVRASGGLVLISAVSVLVTFALAMLLPVINLFGEQVLGLSRVGLAGLLAGPAIITAAALIPSGMLTDRLGRKRPLVAGLAIMSLPFLLAPISTNLFLVAAGGIVAGIGYALVAPSANAMLIDYLPAGSQGLAAGLVVAIQGLGIAFGPISGGLLYESSGPYAPLLATGLVLVASLLLTLPIREAVKAPAAMPVTVGSVPEAAE